MNFHGAPGNHRIGVFCPTRGGHLDRVPVTIHRDLQCRVSEVSTVPVWACRDHALERAAAPLHDAGSAGTQRPLRTDSSWAAELLVSVTLWLAEARTRWPTRRLLARQPRRSPRCTLLGGLKSTSRAPGGFGALHLHPA